MEAGENVPSTPPEDRQFELAPAPLPLGTPVFTGLVLGMLLLSTLQRLGVREPMAVGAGLLWALASGTFASWLARRQQPDRLLLTAERVALARGERSIRAVRLAKLLEVNELQTGSGPVLLLADDRQTLAVGAGQLVVPRAYEEITSLLVERMHAVDPTGELGRTAVAAGRVRDVVAQQPVRGTPVLAGVVGLASLLSMLVLEPSVAGRPFPFEELGALSIPLFSAGETWRAVSYAFLHANGLHLTISLVGILWLGAYLERLVGWERVLLAFFAGTLGGAAGFAVGGLPMPGVGATPGVFGLIGLLAAIATVARRRVPRALLPRPGFWLVTVLLAVLLPFAGSMSVLAHVGAMVLGWAAGAAMVAGADLPSPDEERAPWRAFAILAGLALGIGLVGGVTHARRGHPDDADIVTDAYLQLPPNLASAEVQNNVAYPMLVESQATSEAVDVGAKLAEAAVQNSQRREASILDTLAVARYRQGKGSEARAILEEALRLDTDPRLRKFLEKRLDDVNRQRDLDEGPE